MKIETYGFTLETEITSQVLVRSRRIQEVGVHNGRPFRNSYMHIIRDGIKIILTACKEVFVKFLSQLFKTILNPQFESKLHCFSDNYRSPRIRQFNEFFIFIFKKLIYCSFHAATGFETVIIVDKNISALIHSRIKKI